MPMNRSPPVALSPSQLTHHTSEPNISQISTDVDLCHELGNRPKRKRYENKSGDSQEIKEIVESMFKTLQKEQSLQFYNLTTTMNDIKTQNEELKKSVEFISAKYDGFMAKIDVLEREKKEDRLLLQQLQEKVDYLEKQQRFTTIELKNVPKNKNENKMDLAEYVQKLTNIVKAPIQPQEIVDIYRIGSNHTQAPIILKLNSVLTKEKILKATKQFNKVNTNDKLNTHHLNLKDQPKQPVYVSESLSTRNRRLFMMARDFARTNNYKYCWTSAGNVYIRKEEGASLHKISTEDDLKSVSSNKK